MKNVVSFLLLLLLAVACNTEMNSIEESKLSTESKPPIFSESQLYSNERWGQFAYQHLKYYAVTVDPLSYLPVDQRTLYKAQVDDLKKTKKFDYNFAFDKALEAKKITAKQHQMVKAYIKDLITFTSGMPDKYAIQNWCLQQEQQTRSSADISQPEKDYILTVQTLFRYYYKNKNDDLADDDTKSRTGASRQAAAMADGCDDLCPLNVIGSFVGLGSALGGVTGAAVMFVTGIVALIADPDLCACNANTCTFIRGISTDDICYNASNGLKFKAFGYGSSQPEELVWYFYRDNLKDTPDVVKASGVSGLAFDEMNLTDAEIGGASQIAIKVLSNCGGNYLNSKHYGWYVRANFGKPRFVIYNLDPNNPNQGIIGQNSYFGITGANYVPVTWNVSPTYATVLQNNQYGANFIVQWHYPSGTATVSASASTACGSDTQYLYIQTVP